MFADSGAEHLFTPFRNIHLCCLYHIIYHMQCLIYYREANDANANLYGPYYTRVIRLLLIC